MNETLNFLSEALDKIAALPAGVLLVIALFGLGYLLKNITFIHNKSIPLWVIVAGGLAYPWVDHETVKKVLIGLIIGLAAWLAHKYGLSRIEGKVPFLKGLASTDETPPEK